MTRVFIFVLAAIFSLAAMPLRADLIVFNDLGPGNTHEAGPGLGIGGLSNTAIAAGFTSLASGNLTTVDLGLTYQQQGTPVPVQVYLDQALASGLPDEATAILLGSVTPTTEDGPADALASFNVSGVVPVTLGTSYFLVLKAGSVRALDIWNYSFNQSGTVAISASGGAFGFIFETPEPAFRL